MKIAGLISLEPSHETPPYGFLNVAEPIDVLYVPAFRPVNAKPPSSEVFVEPIVLPEESRRTTVTLGRPTSPFSSLPAVPPPGLKSRQTAPVIAPAFGAGCFAWTEPAGTWSGGMPVSGNNATDPGRTDVLSTIPVCGVPVTFVPDGNASESGPGGEMSSCSAPTTALSAP